MESIDKPGDKREPLAALHIYEPVPTHKLFPRWERILKFGWIGALAVAGAVGYRFWKPEPSPFQVQHFLPVSQWTTGSAFNLAPAISHDGRVVAYSSDGQGKGPLAIWTRAFDSSKAVQLTSGAFNDGDPDFSPDDRVIAYRSERDGGGIYTQAVTGGAPPKLVAKHGWRPRFSPDGKWIAFFTMGDSYRFGKVFIVLSEGGEPRPIQPSFPYAAYPIWAPDGRHLLFTGSRQDGARDWWISSIDGGEAKRTRALEWLNRSLKIVGYPEQWQGDSIFLSGSEEVESHIWELPISSSTMQAIGLPKRLTNGKAQEMQMAVGPDGRVLFASLHLSSDLWSLPIDADHAKAVGNLEQVTTDAESAQLPSVSAEGSALVYLSEKSGLRDVWISDPDGKNARAVTRFRRIGYRPVLSPDGKRLVYPATLDRACAVLLQEVADPDRYTKLKGCFSVWDWSPDGSSLLTFEPGKSRTVDLLKISTGERRIVLSHPTTNLFGARFSPDGRWIAFSAGVAGAYTRVLVAPFQSGVTALAEWIEVSPEGGDVAWSPDGNVLYFRSKRDGTHCIWAQKLGPAKKPAGEPIAILHLHSASFGLAFLKSTEVSLAVSKDRLTMNLARVKGDLWSMALPQKKEPPVPASSNSK